MNFTIIQYAPCRSWINSIGEEDLKHINQNLRRYKLSVLKFIIFRLQSRFNITNVEICSLVFGEKVVNRKQMTINIGSRPLTKGHVT